MTAHLQKAKQPRFDLADILRKHIGEYKKSYRLSYAQSKVVSAILDCRTPAMGGVWKECDNCKRWEFCYKPCKNRHCPKCGAFEKAQWLEDQKKWILPIHYFHVVFTIDHVFNDLVAFNQKLLFNLFIKVAAQLLKEFGQKYLGGEIGFSLAMHTWGQIMQEHLHTHFIVTGGALVSSPTGYSWNAADHKFLFPVKLLSNQFRNRFCFELAKLWAAGKLNTNDDALDVQAMLTEALSKDWEVYIQKPLYDKEKLLEYLGRYIFRIAISNHRIVAVGKDTVTFKYFDNRDDGEEKEMTLHVFEFIRRFLSHVLPDGFVRVRHFGLHNAGCRLKLQHARRVLGEPFELPVILKLKFLDWFKKITGSDDDPRLCKFCGQGLMLPIREFGPVFGWRLTFHTALGWFTSWKNAFT
ncbi:transposase [Reyranella sp.]|uniref:IS91 family transposase n=1 Tax=Reyranella sp. TaxID=1929291 RepID=UPI00272F7CBA|nr:transposase [Reyranella sp.]MDP2372719.1 transposase [Reyranella sp.]